VDEVTKLIESAKREGDPISLRDFAILELLYSSGGRVSEIVGVNTSDISISQTPEGDVTTLKLRGKGSKERLVPLGKFADSFGCSSCNWLRRQSLPTRI
jgi:integrase/recombinase XerD